MNQIDIQAFPAHGPGAGHDAAGDDEIGRPAHGLPACGGHDPGVGGAGSHHPGIAARKQSNSGGGTRRTQVVEVLPQGQDAVAVHRQRLEPLVELGQPTGDGRPPRPEPLAEPVVDAVLGRRTVRAEVRRHERRPCHVQVGDAGPAGDAVEAQEGGLAVLGRSEAQVALPGQWFEKGLVAVGDQDAQMSVSAAAAQRSGQLRTGQWPVEQGAAHVLPESRPVSRGELVEGLPAGQLPHATGRAEGHVRTRVLGRHQVCGAPEREDSDQVPGRECPAGVARPPARPPGPDR